jgi:hypothetical protein
MEQCPREIKRQAGSGKPEDPAWKFLRNIYVLFQSPSVSPLPATAAHRQNDALRASIWAPLVVSSSMLLSSTAPTPPLGNSDSSISLVASLYLRS